MTQFQKNGPRTIASYSILDLGSSSSSRHGHVLYNPELQCNMAATLLSCDYCSTVDNDITAQLRSDSNDRSSPRRLSSRPRVLLHSCTYLMYLCTLLCFHPRTTAKLSSLIPNHLRCQVPTSCRSKDAVMTSIARAYLTAECRMAERRAVLPILLVAKHPLLFDLTIR